MAKRIDLLDKKTVLRSLKSLPDRFNADDAIERIIMVGCPRYIGCKKDKVGIAADM